MSEDRPSGAGAGGQALLSPEIRLWPDGPPGSPPNLGPGITFISPPIYGHETQMWRNVSDPSFTLFAPGPAKANGIGVILCPGGGWRVLSWKREGIDPARLLAARGYTVFLMGFSAGAFLAVDVALDPPGTKLAFVACLYGGETSGRPVPDDAPPMFAVVAQDDRMFSRIVEGLYADWTTADRPAELHVFAGGNHGFGLGKPGAPVSRWPDLFSDWLAERGL